VALDVAQLKELAVGKTVKVVNTVTGQRFEILYGTGGQRLVLSVDGKAGDLSGNAELLHGGAAQYEIRDGHLVTILRPRRQRQRWRSPGWALLGQGKEDHHEGQGTL
jgi:hypothetical protein